MRSSVDLRSVLVRLLPAFAAVTALGLFVAVVPSKAPEVVATSDDDLYGTPFGEEGSSGGSGEDIAGGPDAPGGDGGGGEGSAGRGGSGGTGASGQSEVGGAGTATGSGGEVARDCSRNKLLEGKTCRPSKFSGDNGGATARGVTKDEIRVAVYQVKQNEQVQAVLNAGGGANNDQRQEVLAAYEKWFNENFETYGRKVKLIFQQGTGQGNDAAAQQADAVTTATEVKAFFSIAVSSAGQPYYEELHRRGVGAFTLQQWPAQFFEAMSPHLFGTLPDRELTFAHTSEYLCKRVLGRAAAHAGDPLYRESPRKFGIIYREAFPDDGPLLQKMLERCGQKVGKMVAYPADISQAVAIATNTVHQMKAEGITTVTCLCDPIAPVYFTQQASKQGWFPEWIHNGFFLTDHPSFGRLYDQTQWRNSFGVSVLGYPELSAENSGYKICRAGGGSQDACLASAASYMTPVRALFTAIELAGPALTDRTLAQGIFAQPALGGGRSPTLSFGRNGPSPYTGVDDVMEVWWSADRQGPDGKPGTHFYVGGGKRYLLGAWPTSPPQVFTNDGSPQPPRDPNQ